MLSLAVLLFVDDIECLVAKGGAGLFFFSVRLPAKRSLLYIAFVSGQHGYAVRVKQKANHHLQHADHRGHRDQTVFDVQIVYISVQPSQAIGPLEFFHRTIDTILNICYY